MTRCSNTVRTGVVACCCFLLAGGCSEFIVGPSGMNHNLDDFEMIGRIVRTRYAFVQFKRINVDSLLSLYRPLARQAKGDEIYPVLHSFLRELKDGHAQLRTDGGSPIMTYEWPRFQHGKAYSPLVVRRYFDKELRVAGKGNIEYEVLTGNIGYIYLASFTEGSWTDDLHGVFAFLSDTKGIIVDVRNNGGGNGVQADFVAQRFTQTPLAYSLYNPDGSVRLSITVEPGGRSTYHGPVVLLINGASFSAAELLAALMERIPTVTTVGDTTGGGGGSNELFRLWSKKRIRIPTSYLTRSDGVMIEWNGIPPDVVVPQTTEDIGQGRDRQLERAIELLK